MNPTEHTETPRDLDKDLEMFEILKPFIARCLTLNHDINNPLAGIVGYCEFLIEEQAQMTPDHREFVIQILRCVERIQVIIEKLSNDKIALSKQIDIPGLMKQYGFAEPSQ